MTSRRDKEKQEKQEKQEKSEKRVRPKEKEVDKSKSKTKSGSKSVSKSSSVKEDSKKKEKKEHKDKTKDKGSSKTKGSKDKDSKDSKTKTKSSTSSSRRAKISSASKDAKDGKDAKESKDRKDSKDGKDTKESKDRKDSKDGKDSKDRKDSKDGKDSKDRKDSKDSKVKSRDKGKDKEPKSSSSRKRARSPSPAPSSVGSSPSSTRAASPVLGPGTDLQSWCEVPSIAHFCSLFRQAFDLLEFDIQELEESLLLINTEDDTSQLTVRLVIKLLKGCSRTFTNNITEDNYNTYLRRLFLSKREEAEEDHLEYTFECRGLLDDAIDFEHLSLRNRVDILNQLCEFRLEAEDVYEKVKNLDASSLRVEPLGNDSEGVTYWYFYGTRLYKETKVMLSKRQRKERKKRKKEKKDKKKKRKKSHRDSISSGEDDDAPSSVSQWSVACLTLQDWEDLTERYKQSKKKSDRELYETLGDSFMPEIRQMFAEKEKEERRRILNLAPKRASSRISRKRLEQEDKDREFAIKLEEQRRIEEEYDEKLREEREIRAEEHKRVAREERIKQREQLMEDRAKRAAERLAEEKGEEADYGNKQRGEHKSTRLRMKPTMSDIESEEDEDVYEPPAATKRKVYESENDDDDDEEEGEEEILSDGSTGVKSATEKRGKGAKRAKKEEKATFTSALLKVGTKSTKDSTLDKLVRKSPGRLLETAGRSLLQKSAGSSNPFDMLAATGTGNTAGGGNKLSFDLYGGHLPVDHGGYTKPLGGDNNGDAVPERSEPVKKVFTNWGGEFFKKNLDYRANTNKILEKMNLKDPSAAAGTSAAGAASFGNRFKTDSGGNGDTAGASGASTANAAIGGSASAPLTSFIPGERFKALLGGAPTTAAQKRTAAASSSPALDLLAKKTKNSSSFYSNF